MKFKYLFFKEKYITFIFLNISVNGKIINFEESKIHLLKKHTNIGCMVCDKEESKCLAWNWNADLPHLAPSQNK